MNIPFKIFPTVGYKNSQFQIVTTKNNLKIDLWKNDKLVKTVIANSNHLTTITNIGVTGKIKAKCEVNEKIIEQEFEVKEALRLGTSELKKVFVFDDTPYSFILMKDRLLLYNEVKNLLTTENHLSPSQIKKIDLSNFLFTTQIGNSEGNITNYGIYNTDNFSITGELLNNYKEIEALPESNLLWTINQTNKVIQCFRIVNKNQNNFFELKRHEGILSYQTDELGENIIIEFKDKIIFQNLRFIEKCQITKKNKNTFLDKWGNEFTLNKSELTYKRIFEEKAIKLKIPFKINIQKENLIYIGDELNHPVKTIDFKIEADIIKEKTTPSIPLNKTYFRHTLSEKIIEINSTHRILPTIDGIHIIQKSMINEFIGVDLMFSEGNWRSRPETKEKKEYSVFFISQKKLNTLIDKCSTLRLAMFK